MELFVVTTPYAVQIFSDQRHWTARHVISLGSIGWLDARSGDDVRIWVMGGWHWAEVGFGLVWLDRGF